MKTIAHQLEQAFRIAIRAAFDGHDVDPLIAPAQNEKFGDYQSNAAMGLAKLITDQTGQKTNPRSVAEQIISHLDLGDLTDTKPDKAWIAGPGFINIKLSASWVAKQLANVAGDATLGIEKASAPLTVVVDYSGPNIAKQMHVGHLRSTIIGDAIARVIEMQGHRVIRQNHIGDWGTQFGMLIAFHRNKSDKTFGDLSHLEDDYRAAKVLFDQDKIAFAPAALKAVVELQGGDAEAVQIWKTIVEITREHYLSIYHRLGVALSTEHERGESFYNTFLPGIVQTLRDKHLARDSEGAVAVFVDGAEKPPVIVEKTGGGYLYATTDLAAINYRVHTLRADRIIYTHDSRQQQHFDQVFRIARQAGFAAPDTKLDYAPFGTMLGADGKPFKTRSGDTVKLKDLLDEAEERALAVITQKNPDLPDDLRKQVAWQVGIGSVKYSDLSKDRVSDYAFAWDQMLSMDGNTAPYLQNAYVRIRSIFRKAGEQSATDATIVLTVPHEMALAKHILRFGEVVEIVGRELKPHHLCAYLYDLATRFHGFYEHCPVLQSERDIRASRLGLSDLTARTLACGLKLLGIEAPEQM